VVPFQGSRSESAFPSSQGCCAERPGAVKGSPLLGAAKRTLDGEDRSEMIAEEVKAGRKVGEKWSAKMVPSPAASNIKSANAHAVRGWELESRAQTARLNIETGVPRIPSKPSRNLLSKQACSNKPSSTCAPTTNSHPPTRTVQPPASSPNCDGRLIISANSPIPPDGQGAPETIRLLSH